MRFFLPFLAALFFHFIPSAQAVVLDWGAPGAAWPSGTLSNSYDIDPGFAGNDITITITGNTGNFLSGYPQLGTDITGGNPVQPALRLQADFPNTTNSFTVTITFHNPAGVLNPTFSIYDIDVGTGSGPFSYQDQIRDIQATFGMTPVSPILSGVGSAVTASGGNTLTGNATVPNNAGNGNATVSFNGPVTQISFVYGSGSSVTGGNPAQQGVAISDITYNGISGVPEINSFWVVAIALLSAALLRIFRAKKSAALLSSTPVE